MVEIPGGGIALFDQRSLDVGSVEREFLVNVGPHLFNLRISLFPSRSVLKLPARP